MTTYRITLTPLEPYFFGNEKNFKYGEITGQKSQSNYYIKSDYTPSQSTLLGMLRYLGLKHVKSDFKYTEKEINDNNVAIGKESFKFESEIEQDFGNIKKIYPLYLSKNKTYFVKTPLDHAGGETYTPFKEYTEDMLPIDLDAKKRDVNSYVDLDTLNIISTKEIFSENDRVGIRRFSNESGFFKKQFVTLNKDYSFCFFADLEGEWSDNLVYLGQNKSLFKVKFEKKDYDINISKMFENHPLKSNLVYCISDSHLSESIYSNCMFTVISTREFRSLTTLIKSKSYLKRFSKSSNLMNLVESGSIFILHDNKKENFDSIANHHAKKIGYNNIWRGYNASTYL